MSALLLIALVGGRIALELGGFAAGFCLLCFGFLKLMDRITRWSTPWASAPRRQYHSTRSTVPPPLAANSSRLQSTIPKL